MKHIKIDQLSLFVIFSLCVGLILLNNGFYIFLPVATLILLFYWLQQPYKPGVFTLILIQHFFQIASAVWLCNYLDKDINYNTSSRSTAIIASSIGLCFLLAPIIHYHQSTIVQTKKSLSTYVKNFSTEKIMYLYIISFFISALLGSIAFMFGGFTQVIFSLVNLKWLLFLLFGYSCLLKKEKINIFYLFVALEFLNGFLGFFSDFKTVIYFLIILLISMIDRLDFKHVFYGFILFIFLGFFALLWGSVKGEYRTFLNGGARSQNVTVDRSEAIQKLGELSSNVDEDKLNSSVSAFLDRLQYTYHFAKTIDRIPSVLPFENGGNWLSSLQYTTTPRFFNPDKPEFDATVKTKKYTGIRYAGRAQGASFSLGYFADCYIDFGIFGMMGMLLLIGLLYRFIYSYLLTKASQNLVFNYAVVGAFFLEFNALEMDSTFLLGRLFANSLTFFFLIQFVFPKLLQYISVKR